MGINKKQSSYGLQLKIFFSMLLLVFLSIQCNEESTFIGGVKDKENTAADTATNPDGGDNPDNIIADGSEGGNVTNDESLDPNNPDGGELGDGDGANSPDDPDIGVKNAFKAEFSLEKPINPAELKHNFWTVTTSGTVKYFSMVDGTIRETKTWTVTNPPTNTGARTLVIDGGLVFSKTGGHLWFINPDETPVGAIASAEGDNFHMLDAAKYGAKAAAADHRACITTYKRGQTGYIGIGYGTGNFIEFELRSTKPYGPIWSKYRIAETPITPLLTGSWGNVWGYSCYVDKEKLIYYGQFYGSLPSAIDITTLTQIPGAELAGKAANGSFVSASFPLVTRTVAQTGDAGSYAMTGDRDGNVYNGTGYYTFAHDHVNQLMFGSVGGTTVNVFKRKCLTTEPNCVQNTDWASFPLQINDVNINIGPMSSLRNGEIIGVTRSSGQIYHVKAKTPGNLMDGINITLLGNADGDPYMYTDFTGSTLYQPDASYLFRLDDEIDYDPSLSLKVITLTWDAVAGKPTTWVDNKLEGRCYVEGEAKGDFQTISGIKDAGEFTTLTLDSCLDKVVNRLEIGLSQLTSDPNAANVDELKVHIKQ